MTTTVDTAYRRSSECADGSCVEVFSSPHGEILVRDSKNPDQTPLSYTRDEWSAFVLGVKAGEFDFDLFDMSGAGSVALH